MPIATLTRRGRVTVPSEIRRARGLHTGDRLSFRVVEGGRIVVEPANVSIADLGGMMRPKRRGVTLEQMEEAILREAFESA